MGANHDNCERYTSSDRAAENGSRPMAKFRTRRGVAKRIIPARPSLATNVARGLPARWRRETYITGRSYQTLAIRNEQRSGKLSELAAQIAQKAPASVAETPRCRREYERNL